MGGYGSGRSWGFGKTTVEDCVSLNINPLVRGRALYAGIHGFGTISWTSTRTGKETASLGYEVNTLDLSFPWIRLFYTITRTGEKVDLKIWLETTQPYFGGHRWWFTCPLMNCNRRVAILHRPPWRRYYGCRYCHDLTYRSCQESHKFDILDAIIARNLGTTPDMIRKALKG